MSRFFIKEEIVANWSIAMQLMTAGVMLDLGVELITEKVHSEDGAGLEFRISYYTEHNDKPESTLTLPRKGAPIELEEEETHTVTPNGYM